MGFKHLKKQKKHCTCNSEELPSEVIESCFTSQQGPVVHTFVLNSLVPIMFNFSSLPFHVNTPLIITLLCRLYSLANGIFSNWVWQSSWSGSVFRFQKCFILPQAVDKEHQRYVNNKPFVLIGYLKLILHATEWVSSRRQIQHMHCPFSAVNTWPERTGLQTVIKTVTHAAHKNTIVWP